MKMTWRNHFFYAMIIKKIRNEITKDKRDSKKAYYTLYFEKNKHKSSDIWKGIRSLVNLKSAKTNIIKLTWSNNCYNNTFNMYYIVYKCLYILIVSLGNMY